MNVIKYDDPTQLPAQWQMDEKGIEAIRIANAMCSTQTGLCANIPIICKGAKCPFIETCGIKAVGMNVDDLKGQRCPVEIADITRRFQWYTAHLEIDADDVVDLGMVKELVDIDVMLERANKRMAAEGDFVEMVAVGVDGEGNAIRKPEIRKSVDFKERMQKRKDTILQLLNATRKDKAGSKVTIDMDPSSYASQLLEKKRQLDSLRNDDNIIDVPNSEIREGANDER